MGCRARRAASKQELAALLRELADKQSRQRIALSRGNEGAIKHWLVLSPIALPANERGARGLDLEQIQGEGSLQPKAGETVVIASRKLKWREVRQADYVIDFNAVSGKETPRSVAYAVCYIWSDSERQGLQMLVGSDEWTKVYVNGHQIYKTSYPHRFAADADRVDKISLNAGLNVLVFKVVNETREWQGSIRLTDDQGQSVQGIHITCDPESRGSRKSF